MSHNFERFCPEHYTEIENYELAKADNFEGWACHHRNGEEFSKEWLLKNNMYYNRTDPHEFKFVRHDEHSRLHNTGDRNHCRQNGSNRKGVTLSETTKRLISKNNGNNQPEVKAKLNKNVELYWEYKRSGGTLVWNDWRHLYGYKGETK